MNIVYLDSFAANPGDISFDNIKSLGNFEYYDRTRSEDVISRSLNAEILIVNKVEITDEILIQLPKLKYLIVSATGTNNIKLSIENRLKLPISNVTNYSSTSVAQHVFAMILGILNKLSYYNDLVKNHEWFHSLDFCFYHHPIFELEGKTLGIIGFGNIGKKVAKIASAFGMEVIVYSRSTNNVENVSIATLDELFSKSDIITLHCPLTQETTNMINKKSLSIMKSNAILINTSRGGLVNEDDLFFALDHGLIMGAGIDVLKNEPPHISNPLIQHPRCLVSPHIAWASVESRQNLIHQIESLIINYQNGNEILNRII